MPIPVIEAAELLLQEKAPRTVPAMPIRNDTGEKKPKTAGPSTTGPTRVPSSIRCARPAR